MIAPQITAHFKKVDQTLFQTAQKIELVDLPQIEAQDYFKELCDSIVSQQLAGKAAATIFERFLNLFPNHQPTPESVLALTDEQLRSVGLSRAKATYIKDLAMKVMDGTIELTHLQELADDKVIEELTAVKGIGRWTAEMFLIFGLGREDVFSTGDLGLVNAIKRLYRMESPSQLDLEQLSLKWAPFRSTASRILWKSLLLKD